VNGDSYTYIEGWGSVESWAGPLHGANTYSLVFLIPLLLSLTLIFLNLRSYCSEKKDIFPSLLAGSE